MKKIQKSTRILAVDLGMREVGFAVFEDKELIRYGVKNVRHVTSSKDLFEKEVGFVRNLMRVNIPHVVILEKSAHPERKKNKVLKKVLTHTKNLAKIHGAKVCEYDSAYAREVVFKGNKPTKKNVSSFIASLYPELSRYVPEKKRILWKYKDYYWLNAFDACVLALAYMELKKTKNSK
ncbi:MAG: hypothetical protein GTN99_06595 [Candidatus Dadabacteria bacterium]|nr:hypothetical protein [Candidatus Dadabacteria bacterium]